MKGWKWGLFWSSLVVIGGLGQGWSPKGEIIAYNSRHSGLQFSIDVKGNAHTNISGCGYTGQWKDPIVIKCDNASIISSGRTLMIILDTEESK